MFREGLVHDHDSLPAGRIRCCELSAGDNRRAQCCKVFGTDIVYPNTPRNGWAPAFVIDDEIQIGSTTASDGHIPGQARGLYTGQRFDPLEQLRRKSYELLLRMAAAECIHAHHKYVAAIEPKVDRIQVVECSAEQSGAENQNQ